jgi:NAD(P)-dependent dehydrogenase (short-subunit alcohol dehydrogenase family)
MDFSGKVVVVTGASRGIGEFIAYEFASLGTNVVVTAKSTKDAPPSVTGTIYSQVELLAKLRADGVVRPKVDPH